MMKDSPNDPLGLLEADVDPPEALHDDVLARLRAEGLVKIARPPMWPAAARPSLAAAAILVAFFVGRAFPSSPPSEVATGVEGTGLDEGSRFALLLYEDARFDPQGRSESELVGMYAGWAAGVARSGALELGEKLGSERLVLEPGEEGATLTPSGAGDALAGFFIVRASNADEAVALARDMPHHRLGGTVVVRPIDPT